MADRPLNVIIATDCGSTTTKAILIEKIGDTYRQTFPPVIFAGMFGHGTDAALLEFDSAAIAEPPKVAF